MYLTSVLFMTLTSEVYPRKIDVNKINKTIDIFVDIRSFRKSNSLIDGRVEENQLILKIIHELIQICFPLK